MTPIIETPRLILREFSLSDATNMYELNADPEVVRYTGDKPFASIMEAATFLENYDSYKKYGYGRWAVVDKVSEAFLGWCGLKFNEEKFVDIGFRFFRKEWNKGYATESARASLDYGFNHLNLDEIIGRASTENNPSIRVLEKLNMHFWKFDDCKGIANSAYYRISKEEYGSKGHI
ncbi:MAG: GNAT family N-acetyltransferase [Bacteroidia bacterium]